MKRFYQTLLILIFSASLTYGQAEKVQAMFVYNFTKYIEWPASTKSGNFVIAILGNSPIYEELIKIAESKNVGNQTIVVRKINSTSEISDQHIVFISENKSSEIERVTNKIGSNPILLITESSGMIGKGAGINFIIVDNKQRFEMKKENITSKGLKISSELEKFAIIR
ncbi:MAG TPA: YfiR family protein [Salinivirgaceae bacterium]|nr:YfiR family protein [Salinivirgaceae bacterium]